MSWAEERAAEVAPYSVFGVKRWTEAFRLIEDNPFRDEVAGYAIKMDAPGFIYTYTRVVER